MREILFRGKTLMGKWVEGAYYKQELFYGDKEDAHIIITSNEILTYDQALEFSVCIPETIGQYTGLTDKNGKKIFEGDILAFSDRLVYVHWHDYRGCWDCSYIKAIEGKATLHEDRSPHKWRYNAEVIGNVYDNPELLEVNNG